MVNDMASFIFKAIPVSILRIIFKADHIIKFIAVHLFDRNLIRMLTEQFKDIFHLAAMMRDQPIRSLMNSFSFILLCTYSAPSSGI